MAGYTIYEKMILLTIANTKKCTHDEIAIMSGCSKRYVADRIKDLDSRGVIEVNKEERPHAYMVYDNKFNERCTEYRNVLEYDDLDSYEKYILIALNSIKVRCSYEEIANKCGCSRRTVIKKIKGLATKGYIEKKVKRISSDLYEKNQYIVNCDMDENGKKDNCSEKSKDVSRECDAPKEEHKTLPKDAQDTLYSEFYSLLNKFIKIIDISLDTVLDKFTSKLNNIFNNQSFNQSNINTANINNQSVPNATSTIFTSSNKKNEIQHTEIANYQFQEICNKVKGYNYKLDDERALLDALSTLFSADGILKHPNKIIRKNMMRINSSVLDNAILKFCEQSAKTTIKHTNKYLATCIYQSIFESSSKEMYINEKLKAVLV